MWDKKKTLISVFPLSKVFAVHFTFTVLCIHLQLNWGDVHMNVWLTACWLTHSSLDYFVGKLNNQVMELVYELPKWLSSFYSHV